MNLALAKQILHRYWGYDEFRPNQWEVIQEILSGNHTIALMPTGGGKSLCFQIPALMLQGLCVVISPLLALMEDQVNQLNKRGVKAMFIPSGTPKKELERLLDNAHYGGYSFLYLSPERLQDHWIQSRLSHMPIVLYAIDEAHCIAQWGHDFRPAYLACSTVHQIKQAPIIALTATATPEVVEEIRTQLNIPGAVVHKTTFARTNIEYQIVKTQDKWYRLKQVLSDQPKSVIIYTNSKDLTERLADELQKNGYSADFFHGGLSGEQKSLKLNAWLVDQTQIMVATTAFGMGIDKADVGLVIHYQLPENLEQYYQETGRAGRDGGKSKALMLYDDQDLGKARDQLAAKKVDRTFIKEVYRHLHAYLRVAYGEKPEGSFLFSMRQFCETYQLTESKTTQAFSLLHHHKIIQLKEIHHPMAQIKWIKPVDIELCEQNSSPHIQFLGWLYRHKPNTNPWVVDIKNLASKARISQKTLHHFLQILHQSDYLNYQTKVEDTEVEYMVPREDDRTIEAFLPSLKPLMESKQKKQNQIFDYLELTQGCRMNYILSYFGEPSNVVCGMCDLCRPVDLPSLEQTLELRKTIVRFLQIKPLNSRTLVDKIEAPEGWILRAITELLQEELIEINRDNDYSIKK